MTTRTNAGRPSTGVGHYLRDLVYGALDGVITTMAVIAGTAGADLPPRVAIILGLANLTADGLSMGASNYLGLKSELEQTGNSIALEAPWRHGLATIASFVVIGTLPLLAYASAASIGTSPLTAAGTTAALALLATGAARAPFVHKPLLASGIEMFVVGAAAGVTAYLIGATTKRWFL